MSKFTEKLGIKPIRAHRFYADVHAKTSEPYCKTEEVRKVEQQNADLLEVLISACQELELYYEVVPGYTSDECEYIDTIKEVTKMPWEKVKEIKQLMGRIE